ncbi:MMPL family transporter [Microbulbifer sp. ANSA002]|uniref:MMPL family transporter n=1 Tax=unclassified Microbulbifer TaxID=2619833 RepID=UPI004041EBA8
MSRRVVIWLSFVSVILGITVLRYQSSWLQTDILLLADNNSDSVSSAGIQKKVSQQLQGSLIWVLVSEGKESQRLARHTQELAQKLKAAKSLESVEYRWTDSESYKEEWELLFPLRQQLLSLEDRALLDATPEELIQRQLSKLYGPDGAGIDLEKDTFSTFRNYFTADIGVTPQVFDGIPVHTEGHKVFTLLYTLAAPVDLTGESDISLLSLQSELKQWAQKNGYSLLVAGAPLHTEYAAAMAQDEIRLIGSLSILAICCLCIVVFRSLKPLLACTFAILCGVASGISGVIIILGQIHILAFVFGTTVSGLAIDYAFHFICNRLRLGKPKDKDILPGLLLGLISSCLAFFSLALTPFPLLQQIGVFVGCGLIGAWLTVILLFPGWINIKHRPLSFSSQFPKLNIRYYLFPLVGLLIFGAAALQKIQFNDNLKLFYQPPEFLTQDEIDLNSLIRSRPDSRYFLVFGEDEQQVLTREWELRNQLDYLVEKEIISGFQGVTNRIPPEEVQEADWMLLSKFYSGDAVRSFYQQLGYSAQDINQQLKSKIQPFNTFNFSEWLPVAGRQYKGLWLGCENNHCYSVVRIYGLTEDLSSLELLPGVTYVDTTRSISNVMSQQRDLLLQLLPLIFIVVFLVTATKTGIKQALSIVALPSSAVLGTLAIVILQGSAINLFHVAALLLVFGIGIDYAIFSHTSRKAEQHYTLLAIAMAGLTTFLGFGLLALSGTPAIANFGLVLAVGTVLTLLLAFLFFCTRGKGY